MPIARIMTKAIIGRATAMVVLVFALLVALPPLGANAQPTEFEDYADSPELAGVHADVFRLYWAFFDREPDVLGASYWAGQYDACVSLLEVTWSFSNSTEFKQKYGNLTNDQYIELVYTNVLDRVPDDEGRDYWLQQLQTGQIIQSEVMLYFSLGEEFKRRHPLPSDDRPYAGCTEPTSAPTKPTRDYWANCTEVRDAGAAPLLRGEPGYRSGLDRDGDGVACEI